MNPRQRALTALAHRESDRVPVFDINVNSPVVQAVLGRDSWMGTGGYAWVQKYGEMLSAGQRDEYVDGLAADTVDFACWAGWDLVVAPFCPGEDPLVPERVGERAWRYEHPETGLWYVMTYLPETDVASQADHSFCHDGPEGLRRYVDWRESRPVVPDDAALEVARRVVLACGRERLVLAGWYDVPGAIDQAWMPLYFEWLLTEPELMDRYLCIETDFVIAQVTRAAELGVDGIVAATDLAGKNGPFISPRLYRERILPHFKRLVDACHARGLVVIKHTDGNIGAIEQELLVDSGVDGYHAIDPSAGMDLAEVKRRHGDRLTLCGNVDAARVLTFGTPQQVRQEVRRCLRQAAAGGGFILASSNSIHSQVPPDNLRAMLDAAREYGQYPIELLQEGRDESRAPSAPACGGHKE